MSLIAINNLSKEYLLKRESKSIINNFSMSCNENDFYCIVGKSGCGKSTLLKIIAGFDKDYSGSVMSNNLKVDSPSTERFMIFQDDNQLFPWKTVFENVFLPLRKSYSSIDKAILKDKVYEYLDLVGLKDYASYYPHQLSGGMKQRVAIARALSLEPLVLLMDEPFCSLDALTREALQNLLIDIRKKTNTTIIFVTHDIEEAIKLSTHILIMDFPPNSVLEVINNDLSFTDDEFSTDFSNLYKHIRNKLHL